jgi:hypothetical protein
MMSLLRWKPIRRVQLRQQIRWMVMMMMLMMMMMIGFDSSTRAGELPQAAVHTMCEYYVVDRYDHYIQKFLVRQSTILLRSGLDPALSASV